MSRKAIFSAYVIPDVGDPIYKPGFHSAVNAESSGLCEARRLLKKRPEVNAIEVVTIEHREHLSTQFLMRGER